MGLRAVEARFERLGWGAEEVWANDFGIDLYVFVRDMDRFEVGTATAQVKAGPAYFRESVSGPDGVASAWVYRESNRDHLDYWLGQPTPHFLILHDDEAGLSFWTVITPQSVTRTTKGWKTSVPAANTLTVGSVPRLLAAYARTASGIGGEGVSWHAADTQLDPADRLRRAILIPRSMAPHPNRGYGEQIDPPAAVALLMLDRRVDLERFARNHESVPSLDAEAHPDWGWQLVSALNAWLEYGETEPLVLCSAVRRLTQRASAAVLASCALLAEGSVNHALDVVEGVLRSRKLGPLDRAWLQCQKGRLEAEVGRDREALRLLERSERALEVMTDWEARALLSAVKSNLWRLDRAWSPGGVGDVVAHTDNRAFWWRTMDAGFRLADEFEDLFDRRIGRYANENSSRSWSSRSSPAWLNATVLGDHSNAAGWQANAAKVATASRPVNLHNASSSLRDLLASGAAKDVGAFASYLWQVGPTAALQDALSSANVLSPTRTSLMPTLELWRVAPDLLRQRAAPAMRFSLRGLTESDHDLRALAGRGTTPWYEFGKACSALLPWVGLEHHREVADWVLMAVDAGYPGALRAQLIERLVQDIRMKDLSTSIQAQIAARAGDVMGEDVGLAGTLLRTLNRTHPDAAAAQAALQRRAMDGDFDALIQLVEPGAGATSRVLEGLLAEALPLETSRIVKEARAGRHVYGGYRVAALQTWFNLSHHQSADWGSLFALLREPAVAAGHKADVCAYFSDHVEDIPDQIVEQLVSELPRISHAEETLFMPGEPLEMHVVRLGYRIGGISADEVIGRILDWSTSAEARDRRAAAVLLAEDLPWDIGQASAWLMRLLSDEIPRVAVRAARSIGVVLPGLDSPTMSLLDRMLEPDQLGCGRSLALLRGLGDAKVSKKTANAAHVRSRLREHPSRAVRRAVADAPRRPLTR